MSAQGGHRSPLQLGAGMNANNLMRVVALSALSLISVPLSAQWKNVPPSNIPRAADGKPNLSAPAPRLPDGKPDLSGVWNPPPPPGYLRDLARDLKEEVPFQPWAK